MRRRVQTAAGLFAPVAIFVAAPDSEREKCPCRTLARRLDLTAAVSGAVMLVGLAMAAAGAVQLFLHS